MASINIQTNATVPSGASLSVVVEEDTTGDGIVDNSNTVSISGGTNTYSVSGFDGSSGNYYRVTPQFSTSSVTDSVASINSASVASTSAPSAPAGASLTVNGDDSIDLTVDPPSDWGGEVGSYEIEMSRDGTVYSNPSGGPSNPSGSTSTQTYNYGPNSDNSYQSQIGIDSSFTFRVRAKNSAGSSGWTYSGTEHTTPVPPTNVSVSRSGANSITVNWTNASDVMTKSSVFYRVDTGSGYGGWQWTGYVEQGDTKGNTHSVTFDATSTTGDLQLQEDARYQFKIRHESTVGSGRKDSPFVYADYGNQGNVFFEDGFESGDLSAWGGDRNLDDAESEVRSDGYADLGISGADDGTYYFRIDSADYIATPDFDGTGSDTDLIVRAVVATGSMDSSAENTTIQVIDRNDGDGWHTIDSFGWEYNKQGWTQVTAIIPSEHVSSSMAVRFLGYGGGGDHFAVDNVVVSDILHEYTKPAAPSGLSLDTSVEREITASWTRNAGLVDVNIRTGEEVRYSKSSVSGDDGIFGASSPTTITGLLDGEQYDVFIRSAYDQYRHGTKSGNFLTDGPTVTATTILSSETPSASTASSTSVDVSWSDIWNNENGIRVDYSTDGGATWTQFSDLPAGTVSETVTGLPDNTDCQFRIEPYTEHVSKNSVSATATTFLEATRTVTSYGSGNSSVQTLIDLGVSPSSSSSPGRSGSLTIIDLGENVNSHLSGTGGSGSRGSASYGNRESASYSSEIKFTVYNERTSLEILDYNIDWDEREVAWYTEWFQEPTIIGNEDVLALRSLVVPDAKEPAATITVQYDKDGNGAVDEESYPINTGQSEETHEVRSIPIEEDGWYRMKITNYTGYNEIYSLDIGRVR